MLEIKFKKILEFNGHEFFYYNELAEFLSDNFNYSLRMIKDNSLFKLLEDCDISLYMKLKESIKDFKHEENVLTYIINKLSNSMKYVTRSFKFKSTYEIALEIKRHLPLVCDEIRLLLSDNLLSKLALEEYNFSKDPSSKRIYDFMLHVEENSEFLFSYYYFYILHASSNDAMPFIINNIPFDKIEDLASYMYTNQKQIKSVIEEIKNNHFVLALIAAKTNINSIALASTSNNYLDMLCMIHEISDYDFRALLRKKMSYWLLDNYHNYSYLTSKAKKIEKQYSEIIKKTDMSFIEVFTQVKLLEDLYQQFLLLYKSDRIAQRKNSIEPFSELYHFGYIYNDDYVCSKYLEDNDLIEMNIYSPEYILGQEKQIINNDINNEISKLGDAEGMLIDYYELFDEARFKITKCRFFLTSILLSIILVGIILLNYLNVSKFETILLYILGIPSILSLLLSLFFTFPEYKKLCDINSRRKKCRRYIKTLNKIKFNVSKLEFYQKEEDDEDEDDSLVKKKVDLSCFNKIDKFYKKAKKISSKEITIKSYNKTVINKFAIMISFLPALSLFNHLLFNMINIKITYKVLSDFPVLYLIPLCINGFFIKKNKFTLISFIIFILSVIVSVIINLI